MPGRFNLFCTNESGAKEGVVMIHAAIAGSLERFLAVLIEHVGGNFPLWLAPEQVKIIPVNEAHLPYAEEVYRTLKTAGLRVSLDADNESMGKKIRAAKTDRLPYFIVLGDQEVADKTVTLEKRDGTKLVLPLAELAAKLKTEVDTKAN